MKCNFDATFPGNTGPVGIGKTLLLPFFLSETHSSNGEDVQGASGWV